VFLEAVEDAENPPTELTGVGRTRVGGVQNGKVAARAMGNVPEHEQCPCFRLLAEARAEEFTWSVQ
jgi:hypothetical protein